MNFDLSMSFALLHLLTFNVPTNPTAAEIQARFDNEKRLRHDLFEEYDGSMPSTQPVKVMPIMSIDHIRELDEDHGSMTVSMTFIFAWMDERLRWNISEYGSIVSFSKTKYEFMMGYDIWVPTIHMTDLPGSTKQADLFMNHDVEMFVHYSGNVKATIKVLVTTPCYFGFGEYPNDYQNCSFTLMTPYYADELQFTDWGGVELSYFMLINKRVTDVQDFQLIDIDTQNYYMYLGVKVVDDISQYKPGHCRGFFRYNMMLKRVNKLLFAQLSIPMIVICLFVGVSGLVPHKYSLSILVFSIGFQLMNVVNMAEILPDDYNGMPTIAVMALFIMVETIGLILWRTFILHLGGGVKIESLEEQKEEESESRTRMIELVYSIDSVMRYVLIVQFFGNFYTIMKSS